ncbi:M15 family metallopeptidase [Paenibacillus gansuensis]|uniref:M15 family metallopeptidase n=1 Tax=Paenibacillus gansuensis TaxID=306542 RepID=A0ABW5PEG6_9BACL
MNMTLQALQSKNEPKLRGLHPVVLAAAQALIMRCFTRGVQILITQGSRSKEYQDELYAQGRTKPGKIVTNARGGHSYHNYGLAIDFALLLNCGREVSWDTLLDADRDCMADWMEVVDEAEKLGFEWGGRWDFVDKPHLQMTFGLEIKELLAGKPVLVPTAAAPAPPPPPQKKLTMAVQVKDKNIASFGYTYNGRSYVPLKAVALALSAPYGWNDTTKKAIFNKVEMQSTNLIGPTSYVHSAELAEATGLTVRYDNKMNKVFIG